VTPLDIAVVMDPIASIAVKKDSTFAMLLEGQRRGHRMHYAHRGGLALAGSRAVGRLAPVQVHDDPADWYRLEPSVLRPLADMDVVLMRKDPPFDAEFLYDTMVLESAQRDGVLVVNDPRGLRDLNEKLAALLFPELCPPTLISRDMEALSAFVREHGDCVLKPLDGMGGRSIFRAHPGDDNLRPILETLTFGGQRLSLVQRYVPEIVDGDKRVLLVDGEAVPYMLARVPQKGDFRGNLAVGGRGEGRPLTAVEAAIAARVGPELRRRGMLFVGLDVIGGFLTEVNVTSPTCIRELDAQFGLNIAGLLFERIESLRG